VRVDPLARAEQLLRLLDDAPDSDDGLRALVTTVGRERALALAAARAARTRGWAPSFVEGRLWLARGNSERAEGCFTRALTAGRQAGKLLGWVGEELIRAGRISQAERLLRAWQPRRPDDAEAVTLLVRLALSRRDSKAALRAQRRLAELRPSQPQVRLVHARLLQEAGSLEEAVKEYEAAVKLASSDAALECQTLLELGPILELLERFDEAVRRYRRGLSLAARGEWAHRELQRRILHSFERRGAGDELVKEARRMLAEDAQSSLALRVLASESARTGKTTDAIGYYGRYLKGAPGDTAARSQLMFLLTRAGRSREAAEQAGELFRRQPSVRHLLEHATLLTSAGEAARARVVLRGGIKRFEGQAEELSQLASALDGSGDDEGARLAYAGLLKLDGAAGTYHRAFGSYLWARSRTAEALAAWSWLRGSPPTRVGYERWVEVVLGARAPAAFAARATLTAQAREGLRRFPGHAGLLALARQLGI